MSAAPSPFRHTLRVRWSEVDPQGVVFNPNYFVYADVAGTEFFRSIGMLQSTMPDLQECYAVDAHAQFRAPARFDDLLDISVAPERPGRSSFTLAIDIHRDETLLVAVRMVYFRARDGESLPLSDNFRARLAAAGGASPG
ncbi:MAG: thioesterase family protein [Brevundimonas sp.]|jgi:acyl-CoA thioester hydrolase|nr:thioesterase family protein [Brevundimonas sp.]